MPQWMNEDDATITAAGALLHLGAVALEHLDHAAADRAEAQKTDPDLFHRTPMTRGEFGEAVEAPSDLTAW